MHGTRWWTFVGSMSMMRPRPVVASPKAPIFTACCFLHTNFARGSPTISGTDYYDLLRATVRAPAGKPPPSLVDSGAGLPPPVGTCGTNCPKFP